MNTLAFWGNNSNQGAWNSSWSNAVCYCTVCSGHSLQCDNNFLSSVVWFWSFIKYYGYSKHFFQGDDHIFSNNNHYRVLLLSLLSWYYGMFGTLSISAWREMARTSGSRERNWLMANSWTSAGTDRNYATQLSEYFFSALLSLWYYHILPSCFLTIKMSFPTQCLLTIIIIFPASSFTLQSSCIGLCEVDIVMSS